MVLSYYLATCCSDDTICATVKRYSTVFLGMTRGGTQLFFGGCVPHGVPKVGSSERIFLEKWGSREQKF